MFSVVYRLLYRWCMVACMCVVCAEGYLWCAACVV